MNIAELIKKLQSIDAKDLKSIDFGQIKTTITSRIDIMIIVVLILATGASTYTIYGGRKKRAQQLKVEVQEKEEKLIVVEKYRKLSKELNDFINNYPEFLPVGRLINKLSEFAVIHNVQIENFSPAKQESDEYTNVTSIQINISSDSYENIILFMEAIESAPYSITVEEWSGKVRDERTSRSRSLRRSYGAVEDIDRPKFIEANVKIASVEIKDE